MKSQRKPSCELIYLVFPPNARSNMNVVADSQLPICKRCEKDLSTSLEMAVGASNAEATTEGSNNQQLDIVDHTTVDWKGFKTRIKMEDVLVSASAIHRVHKSSSLPLTQLRGLRVGNGSFVETGAISADNIRPLARKLQVIGPTPKGTKPPFSLSPLVPSFPARMGLRPGNDDLLAIGFSK